jgi:hypothetical protein
MNTYVRDNMRWLSGNATGGKPMCRAYNSALQTIGTGSATAITFDSERFDLGAMHDTGSNTSRLTVPSGGGGKYLVGGNVAWQANSDSSRRIVQMRLNGSTPIGEENNAAINSASYATVQSLSTIYALAAADYVEVVVRQDAGGNLNVTASGNVSPEGYAIWLAE